VPSELIAHGGIGKDEYKRWARERPGRAAGGRLKR
jgi:hypothetical protein